MSGEGQVMRSIGRLFASAFVLFALCTQAAAEKRVALVIGNASYQSISKLKNPANDANLMAEVLESMGFEVTKVIDANLPAMKKAMLEYERELKSSDAVGLFYYAGHGVQVAGQNYLIPIESKLDDESAVQYHAFDLNVFLHSMHRATSRMNIVILDACRNNPFESKFRSATRGLAQVIAPRGTIIGYATAPGAVAKDGVGKNSPYVSALVKAMSTPGLAIEAVFKQTREDVLKATRNLQTPWEHSSITGEFYFTKPIEESRKKKSDGDTGSLNARDRETAFWNTVHGMNTRIAYELYLERFPNGFFSALAKQSMESLEKQKAKLEKANKPKATETAKRTDRIETSEDPEGSGDSTTQSTQDKKSGRDKSSERLSSKDTDRRLSPERAGDLAFLKCADSNELSCYRDFLWRYPDHKRVSMVEDIIRSRSELPRYQACIESRDPAKQLQLCELYLATFPKGRYTDHVRRIVKRSIVERLRKEKENREKLRHERERVERERIERERAEREIERRKREEQELAMRRFEEEKRSQKREFEIYHGYDLFGADYMRLSGKVSYSSCVSSCRGDTRCKAFTYNTQARACFLKSSVPARQPFANAISGALKSHVGSAPPVVQPTGQCGHGFITYNNSDFYRNDLGGYAANFQRCRQICLGNPSCRGFTWIRKRISKQCWLKHSLPSPTTNHGVISCAKS